MLVNDWREKGEWMVSLARMSVKGDGVSAAVEGDAGEREGVLGSDELNKSGHVP